MSLATCTIHVLRQPGSTVYATPALLKSLEMPKSGTLRFSLGDRSISAPVKVLRRKGNHLWLPPSVTTSIKLPYPGTCLASSRGDREIKLGPLIGILSTVSNSKPTPFGRRGAYLRAIINAGKNKSYYFAFDPKSVNWQQETVVGYFPRDNGTWLSRTIPLPDVIYNRLPNRQAEKSLSINNLKERFVRRGVQLFNWDFFDKWDVYKLLQGENAYKYVPESRINPSPSEIRELIEKHRFVYLKPSGGSLGIGIYRLTYNPKRGYFARFSRNGKNVLLRYSKFDGLTKMLRRSTRGNMENHVVQQGVRLIEQDYCPIDFRFHMTKNGKNKWVVAAVGAKKAGRGSVTTHLRTGGQLMTAEQVLNGVFKARGGQVLQNAKDAAVEIAETIEKNYAHTLGEIGLDIGIDQTENIWMFEANAKPGRSIFKHPMLKPLGRDSLVNLFEHCLYLSKFRTGRDSQ